MRVYSSDTVKIRVNLSSRGQFIAATQFSLRPGELRYDNRLVGGEIRNATQNDFAIARLLSNGTVDSTFGANGIATANISNSGEESRSLILQPDGKIVLGGEAVYSGRGYDFALARYQSNGALDMTFGNAGQVTMGIFAHEVLHGMTLQPDGKLVAVGFSGGISSSTLAGAVVARYETGLQLVTTPVTVGGRVSTPTGLGLRNAVVAITDSQGVRRTATTSSFGVYSFDNVQTGGTYIIGVSSKRYRFASRNLLVNDNLTNVDFVGLE